MFYKMLNVVFSVLKQNVGGGGLLQINHMFYVECIFRSMTLLSLESSESFDQRKISISKSI